MLGVSIRKTWKLGREIFVRIVIYCLKQRRERFSFFFEFLFQFSKRETLFWVVSSSCLLIKKIFIMSFEEREENTSWKKYIFRSLITITSHPARSLILTSISIWKFLSFKCFLNYWKKYTKSVKSHHFLGHKFYLKNIKKLTFRFKYFFLRHNTNWLMFKQILDLWK
jgi:hypothetical protein